jgi:hypothetical protein
VKRNESKKQSNNSKQEKENTENETHAEWVERTKAKAKLMLDQACRKFEEHQAARIAKFGRWAPVVDALEDVAYAVFDVAENAVSDQPRQLAKVHRAREVILARLSGDEASRASLVDVMYTASLLARLVDDELKLGIAAVADNNLATLAAREISDALSFAFARL